MAKRNVYSVICLDEYYNLNTIRNIVQYIHNIPHEQIQVGFQFTDRLGSTLKVVFSGDSNV